MAVAEIAQAGQPDVSEVTRAPQRLLRAVLGNRKATVGALILLLLAFVAAFPGLVANHPPQAAIYRANAGPSSSHLLGTTNLGRTVAIDAANGKVLWEYEHAFRGRSLGDHELLQSPALPAAAGELPVVPKTLDHTPDRRGTVL